MKNYLGIILVTAFLLSCATIQLKPYKQALVEATAQKWTSGARGGDRGVTFRLKFYKLQELKADTLLVNNTPMGTEITKVGDTLYVTSFVHVPQDAPMPKLIRDTTFSGYLNVFVKNENHLLNIKSFKQIPTTLYP